MSKRILLAVAGAWILALSACQSAVEEDALLTVDENQLVDIYVRLSILETLHTAQPDSVDRQLDWMQAHLDTSAVHRALISLQADPARWALFHGTVNKRLAELEEFQDQWWELAIGERPLSEPFE